MYFVLKIIFTPYSKRAVRVLCSSLPKEDFCYQGESKSCLQVIFFLGFSFWKSELLGQKVILRKQDRCVFLGRKKCLQWAKGYENAK